MSTNTVLDQKQEQEQEIEVIILENARSWDEWIASFITKFNEIINPITGIIIANVLMFGIWIAGIIGMIIMYVKINTYKDDYVSGSNLFKTIYAICHGVISIILLLYIIIKSHSFYREPTYTGTMSTVNINIADPPKNIIKGGSKADSRYLGKFIDILTNMPTNIRNDVKNIIEKFNNLEYDGENYKTQVNLGVMFKLVVAHCPIIVFLIVLTSIVSMIKAYHKILCGNTKTGVVIDWYFKLIDIVMYAIFRIIGFFIILMNIFKWQSQFPNTMSFFLYIFYFTAIYLIIRFILLLYENMFSDTIVSLYKWDIRESDCNTDNYGQTGNWILDPDARKQVKEHQITEDKSKSKLTNDVFSLIFNILIILFLSGISIMSVYILFIYSDPNTLSALLKLTTHIGYRTVTRKTKAELATKSNATPSTTETPTESAVTPPAPEAVTAVTGETGETGETAPTESATAVTAAEPFDKRGEHLPPPAPLSRQKTSTPLTEAVFGAHNLPDDSKYNWDGAYTRQQPPTKVTQ